MRISRSIVFGLVVSLAANLIPARAWASDDTTAPAAASVTKPAEPVTTLPAAATNIRASAQAAIARMADQDRQQLTANAATTGARRDRSRDDMQYGGGGGSKMGMVMMLVGTVVGIGMAYYMVQQLKKQQNTGGGQ
jgi:hypothetical protein